MDTIDLTKLVQALRSVPEQKEEMERTPVNGYLKKHLLPIFYADRYPGLTELDFDEFERDDLCDLAAYLERFGRVEYSLEKFNTPICLAPPKATGTRAFL